ncbi:N-acetylmuramoyl-L-alanine amidase [Xanthomonas tesorieronis]|uniref:N-acetylmuramoyl-L-alanine amidase n=1 Tax=Xanthomonas tesorieronis TaxID=3160839 RepID=UPI0035165004
MALIRATRDTVNDRFNVLSFSVRTENPLFEIGLATDPQLLKPENRAQRTARNFFSSRIQPRSKDREAMYLVPPSVMARFVGQPRLYFGLVTYSDRNRSQPIEVNLPDRGSMYVSLAGLSERSLRRATRSGDSGNYGNGGIDLGWGGDAAAPATGNSGSAATAPNAGGGTTGTRGGYSDGYSDELWQQQPAPPASNGAGNAAPPAQAPAAAPAAPAASSPAAPTASAQAWRARSLAQDTASDPDAAYGIEGPIPDDTLSAGSLGLRTLASPLGAPAPQYPQASRFVAANPTNYRASSAPRSIERIVLHITDGGARIDGTLGWFQNPAARVSAHYVIGQDGEVVQMVRHEDVAWHARSANGNSIGIEHVANTRGLRPSQAQLCASAALVLWLCERYGIPADRTHILGHAEADPQTSHRGCPDAVWEWPAYMQSITSRSCLAGPAAATAQGLAVRGAAPRRATAPAQAMRVVGPYYRPSGWLDALRAQLEFFAGSAQWLLGVDDTSVPPHSAICQARRVDGSEGGAAHGSAFFIGPRLLLTAAHVVDGQDELIIVPGKNGAGSDSAGEPRGRFRVGAADMQMHPAYSADNRDFDMALIRVPAGAAAPDYFDLVEELTQSRPEDVVVCGYSAYSPDSSAIGGLVNAVIDPDKQHLHGGHIRSLPSEETFDYDLQSLGGASGSPVYYIEAGDVPRAHMVGVHVAPATATTNLGCRITAGKLAWIRQQAAAWGQTVAFSLGARALAQEAAATSEAEIDPDAFGICEDEPTDSVAAGAQALRANTLQAPAPDYPGASRFAPAHARNFRRGRRAGSSVDRIVIHITAGGPRIDGTIAWFQNGDRPNVSSAHYIVGRDGEVVQMVRNADTAYHASAANSRSVGIEHCANKPSRGNPRDLPLTEPQYQASAQLVAWLCAQFGIAADREHIVGHYEISPRDNHDCPSSIWDWDHYMACVQQALAERSAHATTAQSLATRGYARAQEIITPFYDPSDPATALTCQDDAFSQAREEWFIGVEDTRAFPHSAICQLVSDDGTGTGFYIGRNRILTCAHNLHGSSQVTIVPALNGTGNAPFGSCTVPASSWRLAPGYASSSDSERDLAVIENVPIEAPNGRWFRFLQATPSEHMPLVVCGYSRSSDAVPELTALMNGDKQHLHGGYARAMSSAELIEYPILTLHRASGAPVYALDRSSGQLEARVCAVHISGAPAAQGLNRGCFLTPAKLAWIEGSSSAFALPGTARTLGAEPRYDVPLIPQPDKDACWAASMAMLLSYRRHASIAPETLAAEVGQSLSTSYDWALLDAVKARYGFVAIEQPSNASLYHTPQQWADWLSAHGPLWVVIVGAPHAVVLAGIRGNLADPAATQVLLLNPWDTRVAFDNDPVAFNPPNAGYADWLPFQDFASDFGNMAEPDYGNWRVLYLPATAATAQGLGTGAMRLARPPAPARALDADPAAGQGDEPLEPSRIAGTRMRRVRGSAGGCRWALEQLQGRKAPRSGGSGPSSLAGGDVRIALDDWPAIDGAATPLPLTVRFYAEAGSVGEVRIDAGVPARLDYGVEVSARIDDAEDVGNVATLKVSIDYRFSGLAQGNPAASIELRLLGDGRYERINRWTAQPAGAAVAA